MTSKVNKNTKSNQDSAFFKVLWPQAKVAYSAKYNIQNKIKPYNVIHSHLVVINKQVIGCLTFYKLLQQKKTFFDLFLQSVSQCFKFYGGLCFHQLLRFTKNICSLNRYNSHFLVNMFLPLLLFFIKKTTLQQKSNNGETEKEKTELCNLFILLLIQTNSWSELFNGEKCFWFTSFQQQGCHSFSLKG